MEINPNAIQQFQEVQQKWNSLIGQCDQAHLDQFKATLQKFQNTVDNLYKN